MAVGYKTLVQNLSLFKELDSLPFKVDFAALDDGCGLAARGFLPGACCPGLAESFQKNSAKWQHHVSSNVTIQN